MIWFLLAACLTEPEVEEDSSSPFCVEMSSDGHTLICNATGFPAYSCVWNHSCWFDAGEESWVYACDHANEQRQAQDDLSAWCGGWTTE